MQYPLRNFAPDLDPLTPGVVTDSSDFYPTVKGFRTLPDLRPVTQPLPNPCRGANVLTFPSGDEWFVAGSGDLSGNAALHALRQTAAVNTVAPLSAFATEVLMPTATPGRFRFDVFGTQAVTPQIYAVDGVHVPFSASAASLELDPNTAWKVVPGGPPIASIVAASDFYLFLIKPNSSYWIATANPTLWTPDIASLVVDGELNQTGGIITAAKALRSNMVIYKGSSLFLGTLGGPDIWAFGEISRQIGTPNNEAVISIKDVHYFPGTARSDSGSGILFDDFYAFDGFSIQPIQNQLREWLSARVDIDRGLYGRYDTQRTCAVWHYATVDCAPNLLNETVSLNVRTGQWAKGNLICELPNPVGATIFMPDQAMYRYGATRTDGGAFLVTGDLGDNNQMWACTQWRPHYTVRNGTATLTPVNAYVGGGPYVAGASTPLTQDGFYQVLNTARLQRHILTHTGDFEITGGEITIGPVGKN